MKIVCHTVKDGNDALKAIEMCMQDYGYCMVSDVKNTLGYAICEADEKEGWTDGMLLNCPPYMIQEGEEGPIVIVFRDPVPINTIPASKIHNSDPVNHPNHYQSETGLEAIDVIEAFTFDLTGIEAFNTGNVLKYMCRWKKKNGLIDLKKAKFYLEHLIEHVEKLEKENMK